MNSGPETSLVPTGSPQNNRGAGTLCKKQQPPDFSVANMTEIGKAQWHTMASLPHHVYINTASHLTLYICSAVL